VGLRGHGRRDYAGDYRGIRRQSTNAGMELSEQTIQSQLRTNTTSTVSHCTHFRWERRTKVIIIEVSRNKSDSKQGEWG